MNFLWRELSYNQGLHTHGLIYTFAGLRHGPPQFVGLCPLENSFLVDFAGLWQIQKVRFSPPKSTIVHEIPVEYGRLSQVRYISPQKSAKFAADCGEPW